MKNRKVFSLVCIVLIFLVSIVGVSGITNFAYGFALPDSGQNLCYDPLGNVINCAGTGQDGSYSFNLPSYTDNGDGTVTDNVTGLIWQKEDDGYVYSYLSGAWLQNYDAENVCVQLRTGGYSDWRLPTKKELMSIADYSVPYPGPAINSAYFPNTKSAAYWSSTRDGFYEYYWHNWGVDFSDGGTSIYPDYYFGGTSASLYVRCVRGGNYPDQSFVDNGDGTVTENATGLTWEKEDSGVMTWDAAIAYCESSRLGGYEDWRLPNIKELSSLTNDMWDNASRDKIFFPDTTADSYWSSTSYAFEPKTALYVYFMWDYNGRSSKDTLSYVRCVRGGKIADVSFSLTVTIDSQNGGTVTSSPAGLTCSGNTCQGSFPLGTSVTLTATPANGWAFTQWDTETVCYSQNPLLVTMNTDKTITAKFVWNEKITLNPVDSTPLGYRTPLVLVHGNNMENENQFGWRRYLKEFKNDRAFQRRYKVYLLSWDSSYPNAYNGLAMGYLVDNLPELQNKNITIMAHSRGGIIARYFMNQYTVRNGNRQGQLGGEKVNWLVTLATPHRGSPAADEIWDRFSFDYNHWDLTAFSLCSVSFSDWFFKDSYKFLLWDDVDNELTNEEATWDSACNLGNYTAYLMSNATDLRMLNQNERYYNKIIAFGSNNYDAKVISLPYIQILTANNTDLTSTLRHMLLTQSSRLIAKMPIIPNGYQDGNGVEIDGSYRPFQANDGMVPLISALFLKPGSGRIFSVGKGGRLIYDKKLLKSKCQVYEIVVIENGLIDHLDFLENSRILNIVTDKLKGLSGF